MFCFVFFWLLKRFGEDGRAELAGFPPPPLPSWPLLHRAHPESLTGAHPQRSTRIYLQEEGKNTTQASREASKPREAWLKIQDLCTRDRGELGLPPRVKPGEPGALTSSNERSSLLGGCNKGPIRYESPAALEKMYLGRDYSAHNPPQLVMLVMGPEHCNPKA